MNFATMVVVIVAIVAFALIRVAKYSFEHRRSRDLMPPVDDGAKVQLTREVEALRERVRVLERIATDSNSTNATQSRQIANEIEALRDRQS